MKVRALVPSDVDNLREIHEKFYKNEFEFPNFLHGFLCAFAVTDNEGHIISAGGVRSIAESVIITDKSRTPKEKRLALYNVLDASEFITKHAGYDELHAFIQDENWYRHLTKIGFCPTKGKSLVLEIR